MEGGSSQSWRESIHSQIVKRNNQQLFLFQDLITSHNRIFESYNSLKHENLQLSIQNEKLRTEGNVQVGNGNTSVLESKLLAQQEELTELHRKRGENAQMLIDLNKKLQEKEKQLNSLQESLSEQVSINDSLQREIQRYKTCKTELEKLNQVIRDEHQALQLAFTHLEEKLRKEQDENGKLFEQLMKYKKKDAERLNEENENFLRTKHAILKKELEDAAKDMRGLNLDALPEDGPANKSQVPMKAAIIFKNARERGGCVLLNHEEIKLLKLLGVEMKSGSSDVLVILVSPMPPPEMSASISSPPAEEVLESSLHVVEKNTQLEGRH